MSSEPNLIPWASLSRQSQMHAPETPRDLRDDQFGEPGERNPAARLQGFADQSSLINIEGVSRTNFAQPSVTNPAVRLQGIGMLPADQSSVINALILENLSLRGEIGKMHNVVQNSKIDTADLCSKFGRFANDWSETVKQMQAIHDEQKMFYEEKIEALKKTNEQLMKENKEMKKVIEDFKKLESEFKKQKRLLRLGQIAYKLEILVSEFIFPGDDKASKRARYGTNLKSLKDKISNLKDQKVKEEAASRVEDLNDEMFEDWFLGIVKELKNSRVDTAHPDLGSYEEMRAVINEEFSDDDKKEDMLTALKHLQDMYEKLGRRFGE